LATYHLDREQAKLDWEQAKLDQESSTARIVTLEAEAVSSTARIVSSTARIVTLEAEAVSSAARIVTLEAEAAVNKTQLESYLPFHREWQRLWLGVLLPQLGHEPQAGPLLLCRGPCLVCRGRKAARRVSGPTCVLPCHATGTPSPPRCAALQTSIPHPVRLCMPRACACRTPQLTLQPPARYAGAYAHLPFPTA
jgi:hypothetical protein